MYKRELYHRTLNNYIHSKKFYYIINNTYHLEEIVFNLSSSKYWQLIDFDLGF